MGLTLRQAAERSGKSHSTVHRALKSGKMSGSRAEDGTWDIDPSEVDRVYPRTTHDRTERDTVGQSREALEVRVEMLTAQLERERDTVEDLRARLDRAEERVLMLSAPKESKTVETGPLGRWFSRLRRI